LPKFPDLNLRITTKSFNYKAAPYEVEDITEADASDYDFDCLKF